ncbi:MAG: hypothetical protein Q8P44_09935, partial [Dehalococcoidia bacterium]|nr:hypothetical protein [Dehalococcoidia bacterium]
MEKGARILSMMGADMDMFLRGGGRLSPEETLQVREDLRRIEQVFSRAKRAIITRESPGEGYPASRLEINIVPGSVVVDHGRLDRPGEVANFPFGEVMCVPALQGTQGTVVMDSVGGVGAAYLREPLQFEIENGKAVAITSTGGEGVAFQEKLQMVQENTQGNPFALAEFAIGANPRAVREREGRMHPAPSPYEGEKAAGTIHLAFGNNIFI